MFEFDHKNRLVSADWLTPVLTRGGYLKSGRVTEVVQRPRRFGGMASEFFDLAIGYSSDSSGERPPRCLMKANKPGLFARARKEAEFYDFIRGRRPPSIPDSYGSSIDIELQSVVLLLEDKGDEFATTEWPVPPSITTCERAVRVLARFHSAWWANPELDSIEVAPEPDELEKMAAGFFDRLGDELSPERRAAMEKVVECYPAARRRRAGEINTQTLVHGDAHFWNFLIPRDDVASPIIIDWQTWTADSGASDVAYMVALHWFPERRRRYENRMLTAYLDELHRCGTAYSSDDLWYDYRLLVAGQIMIPCSQAAVNVPAAVWWPHMDRAFSAFEDLDCEEILLP